MRVLTLNRIAVFAEQFLNVMGGNANPVEHYEIFKCTTRNFGVIQARILNTT